MIFKSAKWGNLVIASNSDPLCSFYKTGLLVFETFCTFSFAITKWPHFYNSGDFSVAWTGWYKQKKTKFISPTTAIVSNITVFLFTYCYSKTISRTPCSSSKRDIKLLKSRGRLTEDFLSTHHLSCLFNRMIKILIFFMQWTLKGLSVDK